MTKTPLRDYTIVQAVVGTCNTTPGESPFKTDPAHPLVLSFTEAALENAGNHQSFNGVPLPLKEVYVQHFPTTGDEAKVTRSTVNNILTVIAGTVAADTGEPFEEVLARVKGYIK